MRLFPSIRYLPLNSDSPMMIICSLFVCSCLNLRCVRRWDFSCSPIDIEVEMGESIRMAFLVPVGELLLFCFLARDWRPDGNQRYPWNHGRKRRLESGNCCLESPLFKLLNSITGIWVQQDDASELKCQALKSYKGRAVIYDPRELWDS